jgi:hypothetical protein
MLLLDKPVHLAPGDLRYALIGKGEEEAQIKGVVLDRVRGVIPRPQVCTEEFDFFRALIV